MSTAHARACLEDAEQELTGADVDAAGEAAVLRAYALARASLLRLDPREAPGLLHRAVGVLAHCASLIETIAAERLAARAAIRPALRLVSGGPS